MPSTRFGGQNASLYFSLMASGSSVTQTAPFSMLLDIFALMLRLMEESSSKTPSTVARCSPGSSGE